MFIHYNLQMIELAQKLINIKKSSDLLDVSKDIIEIESNIISLNGDYLNSKSNAKVLDERLTDKYITIKVLKNIHSNIPNSNFKNNPKKVTEYDFLINSLLIDKYGIVAHVLIKEGVISKIEDFITISEN